ncbi:MAG: TlpA family protein disulfide reductase [Rhodoplanes sp.]|nr:TlpA family protein disulfide reductase [Rhodoplanes sp.]
MAPEFRGEAMLPNRRRAVAAAAVMSGMVSAERSESGRADRFRAALSTAGAVALLVILALVPAATPALSAETRLVPWTGDTPPAFTLDDLAGHRITLDDSPGRVVLVHFFATWCEPCRAELGALRDFAARHEAHALTVLAVDVGEVDARVRRFVATTDFDHPVLLDRDRAVAKAWGISALPTTVALDAGRTPRLVAEGDLDWSSDAVTEALAPLLGEQAPDARAIRGAGAP